jgi:hypothetical protein
MILFFFFENNKNGFFYFYDAWGRSPPENWSRNFPFFLLLLSLIKDKTQNQRDAL